jgi:hypothetical protein
MSLQKFFTAAVVTASLTMASVAPAHAGGMPVAPTSSSNNAEVALGAMLLIGLFAWITTGSASSAASSGASVTRNGGQTTGNFTVLKF